MSVKPENNNDNQKPSEFLSNLEKKLKSKNSKPEQTEADKVGDVNKKASPQPPPKNGDGIASKITLFILLGFLGLTLFNINKTETKIEKRIVTNYSAFIQSVKGNEITGKVSIINNKKAHYNIAGRAYETQIPEFSAKLEEILIDSNIEFSYVTEEMNAILAFLLNFLPWFLIIFVMWFVLARQFKGKGGGGFNFGQSRAKMIDEKSVKETFNDVEGCDEAKEELKEIISFLKNPQQYHEIGAKIPKGVLLVGPPGTGKTLLAKAVAGESGVPFFSMSGSDFVEMFVGVGASRVRDLFERGKKSAPCILFIDELDAVGRMRGAGYGGGHDEREQTLNQMLVEMDGFGTHDTVIVMAATNRPDVLDKALLRPGRFDRQVVVDVPDIKGRLGIIKLHSSKIKVDTDVNFDILAKGTPGFTGADLANMINEAALLAARKGKKLAAMKEFEEAKDKVLMGTERKSMLISDEEKLNTAYHEAGHALAGILLEQADQLHKVSIIPRGRTLGTTFFFPEDGVHTRSKGKLEATIRMTFGGRAAEELIFKDYTSGAANDIQVATRIARTMVTELGMSKLGPIAFGEKEQPVFIGKEIARQDHLSQDSMQKVDQEIKSMLTIAYKDTFDLLKSNKKMLDKLAQALVENETLDVFEIYELLNLKIPARLTKVL